MTPEIQSAIERGVIAEIRVESECVLCDLREAAFVTTDTTDIAIICHECLPAYLQERSPSPGKIIEGKD